MTHGFFKYICLMVALAFFFFPGARGADSVDGSAAFPQSLNPGASSPVVNRKPPFLSGGAAWDSGFIPFAQGETKTVFHNIGGDPVNYIVFMQFYAQYSGGMNQIAFGGNDLGKKTWGEDCNNYQIGAYWNSLNSFNITVTRRQNDASAENIRIRIWVDTAPAWDSGWTSLVAGAEATTLNHNLGGSSDEYVVYMEQKSAEYGVNQVFYGGGDLGNASFGGTHANHRVGSFFKSLNTTSIKVFRREEDFFAEQVRIRIFKIPKSTFDSGWVAVSYGALTSFNHYIGGNAHDYLVDLQMRNITEGVNNKFYGGADQGTSVLPGYYEDDRIGTWWTGLSDRKIDIFRNYEDIFAQEVRVRIWNFWSPPSPNFDSGWTSIAQGATQVFNHDLNTGQSALMVDMQQKGTNGATNHTGYGGMDLGPIKNPNDRTGAWWFNLTANQVSVFRRNEDEYAAQARIRVWITPKPEYDSDWFLITAGGAAKILNHNLGGDAADYLVDMQQTNVMDGINHVYYGGKDLGNKASGTVSENDRVGAQWHSLTNSSITVYRRSEDDFAQNARVRIWRMAKPGYDSGWSSVAAGSNLEMTHNLKGNPHRYYIYFQFLDAGLLGVNQCFYGGNVFGTHPASGSTDDYVGAAWGNLTGSTIEVFRGAKDEVADNHVIRIWRTPPLVSPRGILDYLLGITPLNQRMLDEADTNGDVKVNIADFNYLLQD